jgi:hypothetical protein
MNELVERSLVPLVHRLLADHAFRNMRAKAQKFYRLQVSSNSSRPLCASKNSSPPSIYASLAFIEGRKAAGRTQGVAQPRCHFNALERFECRMWIGGTPWDRKRSSTKVGPRIALAVPNRQMTSRFAKCYFCSRCSGNWPRRKQEGAITRPHRVKTALSCMHHHPCFHRAFGHVASFLRSLPPRCSYPGSCRRANTGQSRGRGRVLHQAVLSVAAVRSTGDRRRTLLLSLHAGAEQYPP